MDLPLERLREVAEADLARNQEAFLETAARLGGPEATPMKSSLRANAATRLQKI